MKEIFGEYGMLLLTAAVALCVTVFVLGSLLGADGVLKACWALLRMACWEADHENHGKEYGMLAVILMMRDVFLWVISYCTSISEGGGA